MEEKEKLLQEIAKYERLVSMHQSSHNCTTYQGSSSDPHLATVIHPIPWTIHERYKLVNTSVRKADNASGLAHKTYHTSHIHIDQPEKKAVTPHCTVSKSNTCNNSIHNVRAISDPSLYKWKNPNVVHSQDDMVVTLKSTNHGRSLMRVKTVPASLSSKGVDTENSFSMLRAEANHNSSSRFIVKEKGNKEVPVQSRTSAAMAVDKLSLILPESRAENSSIKNSLTNISEVYKKLTSSVQKSLDGSVLRKSEKHKLTSQLPPKLPSLKCKITVHKSNTRLLNKYVPKLKQPVVKTSTKIINKYVTPPHSNQSHHYTKIRNAFQKHLHQNHHSSTQEPHHRIHTRKYFKGLSNTYNSNTREIINIDGQLYKKIVKQNRSYHVTDLQPKPTQLDQSQHKNVIGDRRGIKVVHIRGVPFSLSHNGQKLEKLSNKAAVTKKTGRSTSAISTPNRLRLGNTVFIRKSQAEYIKDAAASTQKLASQKITKSLDMIRRRDIKENDCQKQYCLYYNRFGRCSRGDKCRFLHDPKKIAVCTRFLRGSCKVTKCPFSHEVSENKMPVCRFFLESYCNKTTCPYLHVNVGKQADVCSDFQKGFCSAGKNCSKLHIFACKEFRQTGVCSRGRDCKFTHVEPKKYRAKAEGSAHISFTSSNDCLLSGSMEDMVKKNISPSVSKSSSGARCPSFLGLPLSDGDGDDDDDCADGDNDDSDCFSDNDSCSSLHIFNTVSQIK